MRTRLLLVILLLVVVPTAVLSLLASRALRNWEAGLTRDIELAAGAAIEALAQGAATEMEEALHQAALILTDSLVRGWQPDQVREAAARAKGVKPFVGEVFVFMNPWGFLHPPAATGDRAAGGAGDAIGRDRTDRLAVELARLVAQPRPATDTIHVALDGAHYCFTAVHERRSLYVGYLVDMRAFRRTVERLAASRRRGVFRLVVEWGAGSRETDEGVVVRDSFGGEARGGERFAPPGGSPGRGGVAEGRLRAPFSFVVVRAVLSRPDAIAETGRNQSRLFAWGIALLGGGVGLGSLVVFRLAAQEIRRARARSDFVLGVSHDLRTPLASMRVLAESLYLDRVQAEEQRKRFLGTIVRESDRLGQLIERVLFLVRFGQGSLACRLRPVSLDTLLEAAIQSVRARFAVEDAGVRVPVIQQNFDPSAVWVLADEAALTQVFWNLLDNAVKYSLCISGGEPARTTVTVRSYTIRRRRSWWRTERRWIVISVADRGLGIEKRDLRRVFRPYFRSPAAVDANISGVGLGLTVCRHVVALHGGWMEVSSRLGEGSEFRAILPLHHEVGPCAVLAGEETPSGKRPVRDGSLGRETTA